MFRSCAANNATQYRLFSSRKVVIPRCNPVLKQIRSKSNAVKPPSSASLAVKYAGALVLGASTATIGAAGYAYFDPQFRHDLEELIPPTKDLLHTLYGEYSYKPRNPNEVQMEDGSLLKKRTFKVKEEDKNNKEEIKVMPSKSKAKQNTGDSSVLAVSSVDQSAVSIVDLDISNRATDANTPMVKNEEQTVAKPVESTKPHASVEVNSEIKENHIGTKSVVEISNNEQTEAVAINVEAPKELESQKEGEQKSSENMAAKEHLEATQSEEPIIPAPDEIQGKDRQSLENLIQSGIDNLQKLGEDARNLQKEAADSIYLYVDKVSNALSDTTKDDDLKKWSSASAMEHESQTKIDKAKATEMKVLEEISHLEQLIHDVRKSGASDVADAASDLCARVSLSLAKTRDSIKEASSHLEIKNDFHTMVNNAEKHFEDELAKIGLEIKDTEGVQANRPKAILAYALKKNELLLKELEHRKVDEEKRLHDLLSAQQLEYERRLTAQLSSQKDALTREASSAKEKLESELLTQYEAEIRHQLKRQAAAHRDHVSDVIRVQSEQLERKFKEESTKILQDQELDHQHSIAENVSRLKAILASIDLLNDIEYRQRKAQQLMIAVQSLKTTMNDEVINGQSRTLLPEIIAVKSSSDSSDEVRNALTTIPSHVSQNGVITEDCLKERFNKVHSVCRRVAMVGEEGGSLWTYTLSYLRSLLTFEVQASDTIVEAINPDEIDTYTLLAKAKYCIKNGDWEQALKFMSLLNGLPRQLASDWIQDAVNYLETKQAVDFLNAYSLSLGVGSIPE